MSFEILGLHSVVELKSFQVALFFKVIKVQILWLLPEFKVLTLMKWRLDFKLLPHLVETWFKTYLQVFQPLCQHQVWKLEQMTSNDQDKPSCNFPLSSDSLYGCIHSAIFLFYRFAQQLFKCSFLEYRTLQFKLHWWIVFASYLLHRINQCCF